MTVPPKMKGPENGLLLIGSSTGGVPVVKTLLQGMELENQTVIVCQHIGGGELSQNLYESFQRSHRQLVLVKEERLVEKGKVYLLAGGTDFQLKDKYDKTYLVPVSDASAKYHPSFNTLVSSTLALKEKATILILSGLGDDGTRYLNQARKNGAYVVVQDPATAIAPFMPNAALLSGEVDEVVPGNQLHDYLMRKAG